MISYLMFSTYIIQSSNKFRVVYLAIAQLVERTAVKENTFTVWSGVRYSRDFTLLAQSVERQPFKLLVVGSSPT